jgi:hypothetical protein
MNLLSVLFLILVPVFNIALNTFAWRTAKAANTYIDAVFSPLFLLTMCVGTASVLCMVGLYRQEVQLPKGILLMGAMSILGGSLWGVWYSRVHLNVLDWIIFALIAASMIAKFTKLANW